MRLRALAVSVSSCFCGDEEEEAKASDGRSARSWVKSYSATTVPLPGAAETGKRGDLSMSMGESGIPGDDGACGAGRVDIDCLPGRDVVLAACAPLGLAGSDGLCMPM